MLPGLGARGLGHPAPRCVPAQALCHSLPGPRSAHLYNGRLGDPSPALPESRATASPLCPYSAPNKRLDDMASTHLSSLSTLFPKPIHSKFHLLSPKRYRMMPPLQNVGDKKKPAPNLSSRNRGKKSNPRPDPVLPPFPPCHLSPPGAWPLSLALPALCFLPALRGLA